MALTLCQRILSNYIPICPFELFDSPNRVVIETAGYEKKVASLKRDAALRRFGGVKSKILKDAKKGRSVDDLGKLWQMEPCADRGWCSGLCPEQALIQVGKADGRGDAAGAYLQSYHRQGSVVMGWHQVTSQSANSGVSQVVAGTGLNVISPTWFSLSDNLGNIKSLASSDYVTYCHQNNIQVWGLVSNLENKNVDTTTVLNTTSYRDSLVNNLIAGRFPMIWTVSMSIWRRSVFLPRMAILSLSRNCPSSAKKNDIILSVDNYVPSASTAFYNRSVQADYADYIAVMAYDEHYVGGDEAGIRRIHRFLMEKRCSGYSGRSTGRSDHLRHAFLCQSVGAVR